jgi:hypothetical protein
MSEALDVYSDSFQLNTNPYGASLNFFISPSMPPPPGTPPQPRLLATVRMSLEHLKLMAFMLRRQVMHHEQQTGSDIQVPVQVLNALGIGKEDWESFWKRQA